MYTLQEIDAIVVLIYASPVTQLLQSPRNATFELYLQSWTKQLPSERNVRVSERARARDGE